MDDQTRREDLRRSAAFRSALTVLVARAGGSVTIARDEFLAVQARYGGKARIVATQDNEGAWTLELESRSPGPTERPS